MGDIRDQLQTLTGANLLASQISDAGGKAFVSMNASKTQVDLTEVVQFWRGIHVPTYGMVIPSSSKSVTFDDTNPTILQPAANETAYVNGLSVSNGNGTDTATVTVTIGGATVFVTDVPANGTAIVVGLNALQPFLLAGGQPLAFTVTGTTPGDVSGVCAYALTVQG